MDVLSITATLVLGLFAGSLLTEATILVPYWRRLKANDFLHLHHTLGPHLFRYYAPLTVSAVSLTCVLAFLDRANNKLWAASAALCLLALLIFFIYFKRANQSFAQKSISVSELPEELSRWANWHWLRTIIVILAFGLSISGHLVR